MNLISKNSLVYVSPSKWYSLQYPINWSIEEDGNCTTFYKKSGVGALQISSYDTGSLQSAKDNLVEYLGDEEIEDEVKISFHNSRGKEIAFCTYSKENDFFKVWIITKNEILLFATYNCEIHLKDVEIAEVDNIIKALDILVR
jgi:hypothetical protein